MRMGATKEYMGIHLQVLFSQKRQPARNSVDIYLLLITNIEQETYTNNTEIKETKTTHTTQKQQQDTTYH